MHNFSVTQKDQILVLSNWFEKKKIINYGEQTNGSQVGEAGGGNGWNNHGD